MMRESEQCATLRVETAAHGAPPEWEAWMQRGNRVRVLVVDDEPSICKALEIALTRSGFEVVTVESGETATTFLRAEHFDVMVVDLRIPDMRGDTIFEFAAASQPHLRSATLFMTGDITERAQKLISACKCPTLHKPFDLRDVVDSIHALTPRSTSVSA
jgi:DNA-binding NtrC family response regulator